MSTNSEKVIFLQRRNNKMPWGEVGNWLQAIVLYRVDT